MKPYVLSGNIIRSRSFFKVKGKNWSLVHNIGSSRDIDLIFIMHVYFLKLHILKVKGQMNITFELLEEEALYLSMHVHLMKAHIFTDDMSRSMSNFTVKCQIHRSTGDDLRTLLLY